MGKCNYICEVCGKSFRGFKNNANRFCSRECYWESKRKKEERICPECGKKYMAVPSKLADFCSRKCFYESVGKDTVVTKCAFCGEKVKKWKSQIYKSGNIYCSRACSGMAQRNGWKEQPNFKLHSNISRSIRKALRGSKKRRKWEALVGYTTEDLRRHIERQFLEGMSWDNYGINGWHIDHIIPRSAFNYGTPEDDDFKRCWRLSNLRPMWSTDNIRKGNKLASHFQPRLVFGGSSHAFI